ncbi:hypothetical protein PVAP13_8KG053000 [Panicum virgatum]|uniref:TFIIS N-terminal domain-containing protein n=1 Tax=Panicum virgatum TaxID=38727 RepID=A0A8T0PHA8_PANVG|nr:hypothetical protein PVAP13_8KG053000 [Panicum virgatum]
MDRDERLRRAVAAFGGDAWALVDAALAAAARDRPGELRARRDGIVERLYAAAAAGCSSCDARPPPRDALAAAGLDDEEDAEEAAAAAPASPEAEGDAVGAGAAEEVAAGCEPGLESRIMAIRDFLEDPDQPDDELVSLLQNLADMDVTYKALQETDIGRHVNGLRKHPSAEVRRLVKQLIRKWKEIVDEWVRLHNSGGDGGSSIIADGYSPEKVQGRSHQSPRKVTRDHKDSLLDLDRLDSARKRLQENYQEAQNAKKQRTIQVMDISDIPKPKNRNALIRKSGSGGLPARHR